jgi:hypothetical protein
MSAVGNVGRGVGRAGAVRSGLAPSLGAFGLATFVFAVLAGLALQTVVLPAVPALHAGHGIVANTDGLLFHDRAVELAAAIRAVGWSVWSLRPELQAPVGLSAAAYALTGVERPLVLLPVAAALFAAGATALLFALRACGPPAAAAVAALPFVLFPTAVQIYGQVHKDAWSIAGYLVLLAAWIVLAHRGPTSWRRSLLAVALAVGGCLAIWVVRPQVLQIAIAASAAAAVLLAVLSGRRRSRSWWAAVVACVLVPVAVRMVLPTGPGEFDVPPVAGTLGFADRLAIGLSHSRALFVTGFAGAGSNIDVDVRFASVHDVVAYLPRALQIGLLAPFPDTWFGVGSGPGSRVMRLVAAGEMTLAYALLAGIPLLLAFGPRDRTPVLIVLAFALAMVLVYALAVPNVGTVYRMRYAGWQLALGLGALGWAALLARR